MGSMHNNVSVLYMGSIHGVNIGSMSIMHCRVAYMEAYMGNIHVEQAFSCIHAWVAYNWEQTWKMDAFTGSICWEHTSMGSIHGKHIWGA
jgi:hypothetical protein